MAGIRKTVDLDKAKALYDSGMSLDSVGETLNISSTLIRRRFVEAGISRRKSTRLSVPPPPRSGERICSCCRRSVVPKRPVNGVVLTRLCARCYRESISEEEKHGRFLDLASVRI